MNLLTRSELLRRYRPNEEGRALHRQYYAQLVHEGVIGYVVRSIGHERLLASTDPYLNDIPLHLWDRAALLLPTDALARRFEDLGDRRSLAGMVCVLKEAARQYIERQRGAG